MASGFPGAIDSFTNPLTTSALNSPSHAGQHQDLNDAVNKIETYMGLVKVIPTSGTNCTISATGTAAITSGNSTITVIGAFSSLYESYRIVISNVVMSSTSSGTTIYCKMHDGTNPANSNYNWATARIDIAATTIVGVTSQLGINGIFIGRGTGDRFATAFDVLNPNIATHTIFPQISGVNTSTGYMYNGTGMHQTSTAYTSFQIITDTGTFTSGNIRVYGYRN